MADFHARILHALDANPEKRTAYPRRADLRALLNERNALCAEVAGLRNDVSVLEELLGHSTVPIPAGIPIPLAAILIAAAVLATWMILRT